MQNAPGPFNHVLEHPAPRTVCFSLLVLRLRTGSSGSNMAFWTGMPGTNVKTLLFKIHVIFKKVEITQNTI